LIFREERFEVHNIDKTTLKTTFEEEHESGLAHSLEGERRVSTTITEVESGS